MINEADLDEETKALAIKATHLRSRNAELIAAIEQLQGNGAVDISHARIDHMWAAMVEWGLITPTQMYEKLIEFELHVRPQLKAARDSATNFARERAMAASQRNQPGLVLPRGARGEPKRLFVPGQGEVTTSAPRPEGPKR